MLMEVIQFFVPFLSIKHSVCIQIHSGFYPSFLYNLKWRVVLTKKKFQNRIIDFSLISAFFRSVAKIVELMMMV